MKFVRRPIRDYKKISLGYTMEPIACPICGNLLDILTITHVEKHGTTKDEFLHNYPQFEHEAFWGILPQYLMKLYGKSIMRLE